MPQSPSRVASPSTFSLPGTARPDETAAWIALAHLEALYPGFRGWFWSKVAPDLAIGRRRLFVHVGADGYDGIVIAKRGVECKLCTVWTSPTVRLRGIADGLILEAMDWMETGTPLLTIPEERLSDFGGLLGRHDFRATEALTSYYRPDRTEHVFNGLLRPSTSN